MRPEERDPAHLWDMLEAARAVVDFTQNRTRTDSGADHGFGTPHTAPSATGGVMRFIPKPIQAIVEEGNRPVDPAQNGIQQYTKLENWLVLLVWLNDLFGYPRNRDLFTDLKEAE